MAHVAQQIFFNDVKNKFPDMFTNKLVLDIGSLDINGSNRMLFDNCVYTGVDLLPGNNVDLVSKGHELKFPDNSFDVVISGECFEHDMFYKDTIQNMYRMLKPGGLFTFTCASTGRPEHGTRRSEPESAPFLKEFDYWVDYYKNLTEDDIREIIPIENDFTEFNFGVDNTVHDLYFWGIKATTKELSTPPTGVLRDIFYNNLTRQCIKWSNYFDIYERHFSKFVNKNPVVVEIGVFSGGSLEMWKKYFGPGSTIIGVDINEDVISVTPDDCRTVIGNQADPDFWNKFFELFPNVDVVIDDGSHQYIHQIVSLEQIFPRLAIGGVYLCEDTMCNYWPVFEGGVNEKTFINYTKRVVDALYGAHYKPEDITPDSTMFNDYYRNVAALHFYTGVVVIDKETYVEEKWAENFPNRQ